MKQNGGQSVGLTLLGGEGTVEQIEALVGEGLVRVEVEGDRRRVDALLAAG